MANSEDPDQMLYSVESDQDLHCLFRYVHLSNNYKINKKNSLNYRRRAFITFFFFSLTLYSHYNKLTVLFFLSTITAHAAVGRFFLFFFFCLFFFFLLLLFFVCCFLFFFVVFF